MTNESLILFREKEIRRTWHSNQWWYCILDVVAAVSDSTNPANYIKDMRKRDSQLEKRWKDIATLLPLATAGGKQNISCANTEGILRIMQSIPSPKAEPFKLWLAKVGYERIQEIDNPELAQDRMKDIYQQKGYSKDWIDKRLRGIAVRQSLTEEWKERGINNPSEYAILTAEISKATFGMTPQEYRNHKNLPTQSNTTLRDNMTDLELIFTMLGERVTTEISEKEKPEKFHQSKQVAKRGGSVAGNARKDTEKEIGSSIITPNNNLPQSENQDD